MKIMHADVADLQPQVFADFKIIFYQRCLHLRTKII
jgi:hypothetical protein